ncbi:MAG: DNA-3-methyladenine glycosylase 2 family protein [Chloroflexota bacterium]|nr:DNA-3-methyladenine glycosylase 2 family protein [Chloroflexota bacterium]
MSEPDAEDFVPLPSPIALALTIGPIAHGRGDPTIRFSPDGIWRATRTLDGPATMRLRTVKDGVAVQAWGPGAAAAVEGAADLVGANDDPAALTPHHRLIGELARRFPGLRLPRTNRPFEALLPAICEQKVAGTEARAAFRGIIAVHGEAAPGPAGLRLAPAAPALAELPYFAFHRFGLERRRADLIRRAARLAPRLERMTPVDAYAHLGAVPGIGPWTLAEVGRVAYGDPDALSVGDYHLPNLVAWALAREPRADDARMLELLEPYRGQRGRVQRLLEASGIGAPRYGPRMTPQPIAEI